MRAQKRSKRAQEPPEQLALEGLVAYADAMLEPGADYESVLFADVGFAGQAAERTTFLGCRFARCDFDEISMRHARFSGCLLEASTAAAVDLGDALWREVILAGGRYGALRAPAANWTNVRIRDAKLDFVDLTGARIETVVFERCVIGAIDLGDAHATLLRFDHSRIGELIVEGTRLSRVDLTGATVGSVRGVAGLRGAAITPGQLVELAPVLAAAAGIEVRIAR
jgi:uncharacterized protein YjbI with pentapeptide repeats